VRYVLRQAGPGGRGQGGLTCAARHRRRKAQEWSRSTWARRPDLTRGGLAGSQQRTGDDRSRAHADQRAGRGGGPGGGGATHDALRPRRRGARARW
jgi:hypothetical protein